MSWKRQVPRKWPIALLILALIILICWGNLGGESPAPFEPKSSGQETVQEQEDVVEVQEEPEMFVESPGDLDFVSKMIDLSYLADTSPYSYETLPICTDLTQDFAANPPTSKFDFAMVLNEYQQCSFIILMRFWREVEALLLSYPSVMYVCDQEPNIRRVPLKMFRGNYGGRQEGMTFWAAMPSCQNTTNLLVKLGDPTNADTFLAPKIANLKIEENRGTDSADYEKYFESLKGGQEELIIDMLWISANSQFPIDEYFNNDQIFDKMHITVCQINLEVGGNSPELAKKFHDLLIKLYNQKKYISMRAGIEKINNSTTSFFLNQNTTNLLVKLGDPTNADTFLAPKIPNLKIEEHRGTDSADYEKYFENLKQGQEELIIDMLWISANSQFPIDEYFNNDQIFDKMHITVCQINLEVGGNSPELAKKFHDMLIKLYNQKKYISMRAGIEKINNSTTSFFLNVSDKRCVNKFLR
ncbi:unnamed protein product [Caenorhabditis angaria]|uniref:Uncharacterized protein n=1 Tax=Caenorhabditis angaria TaxID=860376 RepID=A0A9P1IS82_9PELO|nr:unnamed protein product [Caenorhabditis angaria]